MRLQRSHRHAFGLKVMEANVVEMAGLPSTQAGADLVDGVPPLARHKAADLLEALPAYDLRGASGVVSGHADRVPGASIVLAALAIHAGSDAPSRVSQHAAEQPLEVVGR